MTGIKEDLERQLKEMGGTSLVDMEESNKMVISAPKVAHHFYRPKKRSKHHKARKLRAIARHDKSKKNAKLRGNQFRVNRSR